MSKESINRRSCKEMLGLTLIAGRGVRTDNRLLSTLRLELGQQSSWT